VSEVASIYLEITPTVIENGILFVHNRSSENLKRIEIYDLSGKLIQSEKLLNNEVQKIRLDAEKGVYLILLYTENTQLLKRVIMTD